MIESILEELPREFGLLFPAALTLRATSVSAAGKLRSGQGRGGRRKHGDSRQPASPSTPRPSDEPTTDQLLRFPVEPVAVQSDRAAERALRGPYIQRKSSRAEADDGAFAESVDLGMDGVLWSSRPAVTDRAKRGGPTGQRPEALTH